MPNDEVNIAMERAIFETVAGSELRALREELHKEAACSRGRVLPPHVLQASIIRIIDILVGLEEAKEVRINVRNH